MLRSLSQSDLDLRDRILDAINQEQFSQHQQKHLRH